MIDAASLATRFGSPLYVYDLDEVEAAHAALSAALPVPADLLYSLKANPHPAIVAELIRLGCGAEVSSVREIAAAVGAGVTTERCLYVAPTKKPAEIVSALSAGVRWFSVDSPRELRKVDVAARELELPVSIIQRVNVDTGVPSLGLAMTGTASQFGADASWILDSPQEFATSGAATVRGFHFFLGTNIEDEAALRGSFAAAIAHVGPLATALGIKPELVDFGGGFAAPFAIAGERPAYDGLREWLEGLLDRSLAGWRTGAPRIAFESGRYLVGCAGSLVATVLEIKASKGQTFVLLDSGINHLGGMSGLRRVPQIAPTIAGHELSEDIIEVTVTGPLCTPLDTLARRVPLPRVHPGDVVMIPNVGAYGLTASLIAFLSHEVPRELVVRSGRVVDESRIALERRREGEVQPQ